MVAGQDAETTGVEGEALVPSELGTEVGNRVGQVSSVRAGEPVVASASHVVVERSNDLVNLGQELWILKERLPVNWARADRDGIARRNPAPRMNAAEEGASLGVPRPPEVVRDAAQSLKARWDAE